MPGSGHERARQMTGFDAVRRQTAEAAKALGLEIDDSDAAGIAAAVTSVGESFSQVGRLARRLDDTAADGPGGAHRSWGPVEQHDNALGAWRWRTSIAAVPDGVLRDARVVVKDAIAVAGVPMTAGGRLLEYVPREDASVVARVLHAGAAVVGVGVCEDLCCSGSSFTAATGAVRNPHDPSRAAGGSSSGCAVLVATGEAEAGLGTDQGGSVRNPAAWCGVVGLKPTFGLVPYTGAMPVADSVDHIGILAKTTKIAATVLDVVAGPDGRDPRQLHYRSPRTLFRHAVELDDRRLTVGVVEEGFGWPGLSHPRSDDVVRKAIASLARLGHRVERTSVPMHRHGADVFTPISAAGLSRLLPGEDGGPEGSLPAWEAIGDEVRRRVACGAADAPLNAWVAWLAYGMLSLDARQQLLRRAELLRLELCRQYGRALTTFDALAMPTVPLPAHPLPSGTLSPSEHFRTSYEMHVNNCAVSLAGLPAISVPWGNVDGLPVGTMIVGRMWEDDVVMRVARALESTVTVASR